MINDGGPAFPLDINGETIGATYMGMTLRDYFAAKAMQGFAVDYEKTFPSIDATAAAAYRWADAMLKARQS